MKTTEQSFILSKGSEVYFRIIRKKGVCFLKVVKKKKRN